MERAALCRTKKGRWEIRFDDPSKPPQPWRDVPERILEANRRDNKRVRFPVSVQMIDGKVGKVVPDADGPAKRRSAERQPKARVRETQRSAGAETQSRFRNPYNFIPIEDRATVAGSLGDARPVGHARYESDRFSGQLTVRATVKTPLLLPPGEPDGSQDGHPAYGCRTGVDGMPWIAPSSLRGAIRARFEALTNSRFGVVSETLDDVLAFRLGTDDAKRAVPAIVADLDGTLRVVPLAGTSSVPRAQAEPLWAAWLPMSCGPSDKLGHGAFVTARLRRYGHVSRPRPGQKRRVDDDIRVDYDIWVVEQAVLAGRELPSGTWIDQVKGRTRSSLDRYVPMQETLVVHGWVFRTNPSTTQPSNDRRKFERLFFVRSGSPGQRMTEQQAIQQAADRAGSLVMPLAGGLEQGWNAVIAAYDAAKDDRARASGAREAGSAHHRKEAEAHRDARSGLLCYAIVNDRGTRIEHLSPVTIGREPYQKSPRDLLPDSLDLARAWDDLSPADRVFGWVHPDAGASEDRRVALRSSVRVGPARFVPPVDEEPPLIEEVSRTLSILSGPKPSYARFYVAEPGGQPPESGTKRKVGYREGRELRGRKVYPHHQRAEATPGWFQPGGKRPWETSQRSDQNRTVTRAVRAGATFTFDIAVRNLNEVEFGALLEVLQHASGTGRLRLGYGRPLGFGSLELSLEQIRVETGAERAQRLRRFEAGLPEPLPAERRAVITEAFNRAFEKAYGITLAQHRIGRAALAEARGFSDDVPVEYPKAIGVEESFAWFVANERGTARGQPGPKEPLGLLSIDRPYANRRHPSR